MFYRKQNGYLKIFFIFWFCCFSGARATKETQKTISVIKENRLEGLGKILSNVGIKMSKSVQCKGWEFVKLCLDLSSSS